MRRCASACLRIYVLRRCVECSGTSADVHIIMVSWGEHDIWDRWSVLHRIGLCLSSHAISSDVRSKLAFRKSCRVSTYKRTFSESGVESTPSQIIKGNVCNEYWWNIRYTTNSGEEKCDGQSRRKLFLRFLCLQSDAMPIEESHWLTRRLPMTKVRYHWITCIRIDGSHHIGNHIIGKKCATMQMSWLIRRSRVVCRYSVFYRIIASV